MKTKSFIQSLCHKRLLAAALALFITLSTASAAVRTYIATWSGAYFGNGATATATFVLDDSLLQNPGLNDMGVGLPDSAISEFTITVSGASIGNGTFSGSNGSYGIRFYASDALDLSKEWVGQPQPSIDVGALWGPDNGSNGSFRLFRADGVPFAPVTSMESASFEDFTIVTCDANGEPVGDDMLLTSIAPATAGDLYTGVSVSNVSGATVTKLNTPASGPRGSLYCRATLAGTGITSANADCLLKWDFNGATALLRKGDALLDGTIKSIGDPVLNQNATKVALTVTLAVAGTVTTSNDLVLISVDTITGRVTKIAREGDSATDAGTRKFTKFDWVHWAGNFLFIGGSAADAAANPKSISGAWACYNHAANFGFLKVVLPGDSVTVGNTSKTVESVTKPALTAPASSQTRVGDAESVSLLIKTVDKVQVIKRYTPPVFSTR